MSVKPEFVIERQGKSFVLYAGLLDCAFGKGLHSIDTELLQVPSDANGQTAIVKAVARFYPMIEEQNGPEGYKFSGIGDASPQNVSRNIAPHLIRMAETRAKARALRDAINVGMTSLEELGDSDEGDTSNQQRPSPQAASQPSQTNGQNGIQDRNALPATRKQINYLENLLTDSEEGVDGFQKRVGKTLHELTRSEASEYVGKLTGRAG